MRIPDLTALTAGRPAASSYDDVAEAYDRLVRPRYEQIARLVRDRAVEDVDLARADVVELSAGTGALTHQLAPLARTYLATDVSLPMMTVGLGRGGPACAGVEWRVADVEDLALPPASADLVVSSLGPFQDSSDGRSGARRLLRPGGRLVAVTWGDDYRELDLLDGARGRVGLPPRERTSRGALVDGLRSAGFRDVLVEEVRLTVVHASVEAYLAYRRAFGPPPGTAPAAVEDLVRAVAAGAAEHVDRAGRVVLDWQLRVVRGRR